MSAPRPALLVLAAWLGLAAAAGSCRPAQGPEVTFDEARADERRRPAYLAQVVKKARPPRFVARVEYRDERSFRALLPPGRLPRHLPAMATMRDDLAETPPWRRGQVSRVVVLPGAFDRTEVANETVFLLGLIDHELHHARLAFAGFEESYLTPALFDSLPAPAARRLFEAVSELKAYRNEMTVARKYRLPAAYHQVATGAYLTYYLRLFDRDLPVPEGVRDALLVAMFEDWMLRQGRMFTRDEQGWRFEVEGRRYPLPPAVVVALARRARDGGVAAGAGR